MQRLRIYCDGGLGNRLNALVGGLAIAGYFKLEPLVHWPINANCRAAFADLFDREMPLGAESLTGLRGALADHEVLLHDAVAAERLDVRFASAYDFDSLDEFFARIVANGRPVLFYPALIPSWIPAPLIASAVSKLSFAAGIHRVAADFVRDVIGAPYHSLHLRRTDLNIGLTDIEVMRLVQGNPDALFFVCSDDAGAERLAAAHPNVRFRGKSGYVVRGDDGQDWLAPRLDDDGRLMGNLERGRDSVIDAAIDMLVLGRGSIVGYSGSTFQTMARLLGDHYPLADIARPAPLLFFSPREVSRQVAARQLPVRHLVQIAGTWSAELSEPSAVRVLQSALDAYEADDRLQLLYTLAQIARRDRQLQLACIYLRELVRLAPQLADPRTLLGAVEREMIQSQG